MPGRYALIITCSQYDSSELCPLPGASQDAIALSRVLADPNLGEFEVTHIQDEVHHKILRSIHDFTKKHSPKDLLLLHFSGHGIKDDDGNLHFAARNTEVDSLPVTALPAVAINQFLMDARPQQKVLILDCCYGGAYLNSIRHRGVSKDGERADVLRRFPDRQGFVVISSTDELQRALDGAGDAEKGAVTPSPFTHFLVEGIESGKIEGDEEGYIGITRLFDFVSDRMALDQLKQTPVINSFARQGDIPVARVRPKVAGLNKYTTLTVSAEDARRGGWKVLELDGRDEPALVRVPVGVKTGDTVSIKGLGQPGSYGGASGDLIVTLAVSSAQTTAPPSPLAASLRGHTLHVDCAAWSPDGQLVASGSYDNIVRIWDVRSGQVRHVLQGHSLGITDITWNPDGSLVASASYDGSVRVWDIASGQIRLVLEGERGAVRCVAWSPSNRWIAGGSETGKVRLWNASGGNQFRVFGGDRGWVNSIAWSPDSRRLIGATGVGRVLSWDVSEPDPVKPTALLTPDRSFCNSVTWSPAGTLIASGYGDGMMKIWEDPSRQIACSWKAHTGKVLRTRFSADGRFLASQGEDATKIWNCADWRLVAHREGPFSTETYLPMDIHPNSKVVLVPDTDDASMNIWRPELG